jgi:hypothetical protein
MASLFSSVKEKVDFYRASVALFAFGVALLSGVLPVLVKETCKKQHFSALLCFGGSFYFTLAYLRNFRTLKSETESLCVILGCLLAMFLKIYFVPRDNVIIRHPHEEEDPEIELMLPSKDRGYIGSASIDMTQTRIVKPNYESVISIAFCFFAAFLFNIADGIDFASKQHEGYGKLLATVVNAALISIAQGTLQTRNSFLFAHYGRWTVALSFSYPIGILIGIVNPTLLDGFSASIAIALARGVILFSSMVCFVGSQLYTSKSKRTPAAWSHAVGIAVGCSAAIVSCVYF